MAKNQRDLRDVAKAEVVEASPAEAAAEDGPPAHAHPAVEPCESLPEAGAASLAESEESLDRESAIERRLRQVSSAYVELQAQMKSFQERNERLQEERDRRRRGEVVITMFEPVQNLRRSLEAWRRQGVPDDAVQGLALVLDQFQGALARLGLEEINAAPVPFDPAIHDALCTVPTQHPMFDGQVVQVYEAGYRVGSQIIQPARVIIGQYVEPEASTEPDGPADPGGAPGPDPDQSPLPEAT